MSDDDRSKLAEVTLGPLAPRARARIKLTPEALARVFAAIADGGDRTNACAAEGFTYEALRLATKQDPELKEQYEIACALGAGTFVRDIKSLAFSDKPGGWSAIAWLAERLHPTVFAKPVDRVEQTGEGGGPLKVTWYLPGNPRIPSSTDGNEGET